jgi:hypothetical protein
MEEVRERVAGQERVESPASKQAGNEPLNRQNLEATT